MVVHGADGNGETGVGVAVEIDVVVSLPAVAAGPHVDRAQAAARGEHRMGGVGTVADVAGLDGGERERPRALEVAIVGGTPAVAGDIDDRPVVEHGRGRGGARGRQHIAEHLALQRIVYRRVGALGAQKAVADKRRIRGGAGDPNPVEAARCGYASASRAVILVEQDRTGVAIAVDEVVRARCRSVRVDAVKIDVGRQVGMGDLQPVVDDRDHAAVA